VLRRFFLTSLVALAVLIGLATAVVVAWLVDEEVAHDGVVARGVVYQGAPVGGLDVTDLVGRLVNEAEQVDAVSATLVAPGRELIAANGAVGIGLDVDQVAADAMDAGRDGSLVENLWSWVTSFFEPRVVEPSYHLHAAQLGTWLEAQPDAVREAPTEPSFSGAGGSLVVSPGVSGARLYAEPVAGAVAAAIAELDPPFRIDVSWAPLPPLVDEATLAEALTAAEELASRPLTVRVQNKVVRIGRETIRRWLDSVQDGSELSPVLNRERIAASMDRLLLDVETEGTPPRFEVVDGEIRVEFGVPPFRCCGPGVGDVVADAIETGYRGAVALPLVPVADPETIAAELGVTEMIAEFTTNHACCEARVNNIQRMADIVRGALIEPGGSFSINEYVGQRTTEKGFVPAGSIQQGHFKDDVGGGVSQFATTFFNAAFFAGLDFESYQSHSIYISRYPYGREATVSFPQPDLAVHNPTPYGMLVWTEYTGTSITVQLWSTPYFEVRETGQDSYGWGACTRVDTYRERIDPEEGITEDLVFAVYRPGEGLDCSGRPTPRP
jgi:vancomycin resistance protein YoaR